MNITADIQYLQAVVKRLFSRSSQYIVLQIVSYTEIKDRSGFTPRRSGVRVPHRPHKSLRQMRGFLFLRNILKSAKIAYFKHTIVSI